MLGDVHGILDFIADGRVQSIVGALKGASSASNGGAGYVISHRSRAIVVEKWVIRTLVTAGCPVL